MKLIQDTVIVTPSAAIQELKRTLKQRTEWYAHAVRADECPASVAILRLARLRGAILMLESSREAGGAGCGGATRHQKITINL